MITIAQSHAAPGTTIAAAPRMQNGAATKAPCSESSAIVDASRAKGSGIHRKVQVRVAAPPNSKRDLPALHHEDEELAPTLLYQPSAPPLPRPGPRQFRLLERLPASPASVPPASSSSPPPSGVSRVTKRPEAPRRSLPPPPPSLPSVAPISTRSRQAQPIAPLAPRVSATPAAPRPAAPAQTATATAPQPLLAPVREFAPVRKPPPPLPAQRHAAPRPDARFVPLAVSPPLTDRQLGLRIALGAVAFLVSTSWLVSVLFR